MKWKLLFRHPLGVNYTIVDFDLLCLWTWSPGQISFVSWDWVLDVGVRFRNCV